MQQQSAQRMSQVVSKVHMQAEDVNFSPTSGFSCAADMGNPVTSVTRVNMESGEVLSQQQQQRPPADRTSHHPATHLHQGHGAFDRHRHVVIQVGREADVTSGSGDLCYPIVVVCPAN